MVFFLRDKNTDKNIAEVEYYAEENYLEVSSYIYLRNYSDKLCNLTGKDKFDFINNIELINEFRGWLWETYFQGRQNTDTEYDDVLEAIRKILSNVAKHTDTYVVED